MLYYSYQKKGMKEMDNKVIYKLTYYNGIKDNKKYVRLYKTLRECNNMIDTLRNTENGYYNFKITPIKLK